MLPSLAAELHVHGAANAVVDHSPCIDPCVYDEAGAGLEMVRLAHREGAVESIQQRRRGHL